MKRTRRVHNPRYQELYSAPKNKKVVMIWMWEKNLSISVWVFSICDFAVANLILGLIHVATETGSVEFRKTLRIQRFETEKNHTDFLEKFSTKNIQNSRRQVQNKIHQIRYENHRISRKIRKSMFQFFHDFVRGVFNCRKLILVCDLRFVITS